jgi:hypothetical protein
MTPKKLLAKALARYLGDDAVLAFQDGVKLPGQFIVVAAPSTTPVGQATVRYVNALAGPDLIEKVEAMHEVMYSVEVVRNTALLDAGTRAEGIRLQLHGSAAREHMLSYGLAFKNIGAVRDLTQPVDAAEEPRFQFDAFYTTVQSIEATMLSIESIDINGHYRGAFGSVDDTIELRKP